MVLFVIKVIVYAFNICFIRALYVRCLNSSAIHRDGVEIWVKLYIFVEMECEVYDEPLDWWILRV